MQLPIDMRNVTTVVLCGGQGSRLFPLTLTRCKPAMSYGGRYRLVDFPLSNAINSGCRNIFLLTQFLSNSLHKHVFATYGSGLWPMTSVEVLTSEETPGGRTTFQGTADAVRQTIDTLSNTPGDYILILSGDQIYRMDYRALMHTALETDADVVVASLPISAQEASRMGILQIDDQKTITKFLEKPQTKQLLAPFALSAKQIQDHNINPTDEKKYLGSMGIYLFKKQALIDLLKEDRREDFGKHLIPHKVTKGSISAHIHQGYWEDIGTISSFYTANILLTLPKPPFNTYNEQWPLFAQTSHLPGAKIGNTKINQAILCEGVISEAKEISHSILGPRTNVQSGCIIRNTYIMGHDTNETVKNTKYTIGKNTIIDTAIIDKHVTIGSNVKLVNELQIDTYDSDIAYIRDGIIVVPHGTTVPDGYTL
jgi:glucose-1-phosphate adenylyltransferase